METPEVLKEKYDTLAKKYDLPSWNQLDKEFELMYVPPISEVRHPIAFVARRIRDRLSYILGHLNSVVNPPQNNMLSTREHSFLSPDDHKEVLMLMSIIMASLSKPELAVNMSDKGQVEVLKDRIATWKKIKPKYLKIGKKIEHGWKKTVKSK